MQYITYLTGYFIFHPIIFDENKNIDKINQEINDINGQYQALFNVNANRKVRKFW